MSFRSAILHKSIHVNIAVAKTTNKKRQNRDGNERRRRRIYAGAYNVSENSKARKGEERESLRRFFFKASVDSRHHCNTNSVAQSFKDSDRRY